MAIVVAGVFWPRCHSMICGPEKAGGPELLVGLGRQFLFFNVQLNTWWLPVRNRDKACVTTHTLRKVGGGKLLVFGMGHRVIRGPTRNCTIMLDTFFFGGNGGFCVEMWWAIQLCLILLQSERDHWTRSYISKAHVLHPKIKTFLIIIIYREPKSKVYFQLFWVVVLRTI